MQRSPVISLLVVGAALFTLASAGQASAAPHSGSAKSFVRAAEGIEIRSIGWRQRGPRLRFALRFNHPLKMDRLVRVPRVAPRSGRSYVCIRISRKSGSPSVCIARTAKGRRAVFASRTRSSGRPGKPRRLRGWKVRLAGRSARLDGDVRRMPGGPRVARIRALSRSTSGACAPAEPPPATEEAPPATETPPPATEEAPPATDDSAAAETPTQEARCEGRVPRDGTIRLSLVRPRVVGCTRPGSRLVIRGPSGPRRVALSFDDGPSPYTASIARVLDRAGAHGTFYVLGQQVRRSAATVARLHRSGHEVANHSYGHERLPGGHSLSSTNAAIRSATGFTPCTFRPPYGLVSSGLVGSAAALGMSTVLWDVDTNDWQRPGSGAIRARAMAARPGSIVLMHDGGGNRSQTLAALPGIVSGLQARGYRLVTVSRLLGSKPLWRPR